MNRHEWFAVRTVPGSQKPRREFKVELTTSRKGYRISPKIDESLSAIERALSENGFSYYMPAEKRLIRDRRHTDMWKVRRFALMVGYVFIHKPHSFGALGETYGVHEVVSDQHGNPYGIDLLDILVLRKLESQAEAAFDEQVKRARQNARKKAKRDPRLKMLIDQLDIAGKMTFAPDFDFSNQTMVA
ncbi:MULTISPECIES: hypothetical protein [unclassified Rhizobium]|uniref:hypothetical protein n=1 Tax=unclassified Rhizobium TaxID=2613769 RepID=UPI001ADC81A2|nr:MULTISPECIES: hypothetical protein [unclassified Rhizobium]MBO9099458.1 hypothetical protein [Rhizobium sp. L58/93]QXZ87057.1 hypothetical protein J5287_20945 [Rhizobium sp. K1/93]QXZ92909.1 hypothetical protein J5280_19950 [Rhizobium sp. K15/93]